MSADEKHIGDSSLEINTANPQNWKSVGEVAADLARRIALRGAK